MSTEKLPGVRLEGRVVPFPQSVSPEAQAFLASLVGPDGTPYNAMVKNPAPDDVEGWKAAKAQAGAVMAQFFSMRAGNLSSSVDTIELGGATVHRATPAGGGRDGLAYIDIHGGALVHGDGEPCRIGARIAADLHGVRAYAVDYRMPPEHPYPAALDDCLAAYRALLADYAPQNLVIGGGSAGGNLAAAMVLRARDEGLPMPAALVLITPELDLTESGDSFETNSMIDVMLPRRLTEANLLYANGHDLAHPYLSPLFGDFGKGFPPTFLQAGTRDLFLSNVARMHRSLRRADVPVDLHICEGMPHGGFMGAPEDLELSEEIKQFVRQRWGGGGQR